MTDEWPAHFRPEVVRHAFGGGKLSSYCIALEAWRRGLEVTFTDTALRNYRISDERKTLHFNDSRPQTLTKHSDYSKLMSKSAAINHLRAHGIPTPTSRRFDPSETNERDLRLLADSVGYPLVLKPDAGSMGNGVFTGIRTWEELNDTYKHVLETRKPSNLVIESHHTGSDHRILVIGNQVVAATRRVRTHVIGDGRSTVESLIEAKNAVRKKNPFLSSGLIKVDYEVESLLAEQHLGRDSVPEDEQHVLLRRMANGSAGGDVVDVTEELPSEVLEAAVKAVQIFDNIHIAGVDLLYQTPNSDTRAESSYVVIEMNSRPHIPTNMYPSSGTGRDVPRHFIDYFFPGTQRRQEPGIESMVFDYPTLETTLKSRVASEVILASPPNLKARTRIHLVTGASYVNMPRARRARLERIAAKLDLTGDVIQPRRGAVIATLGAQSPEHIDEFVTALAEALQGHTESSEAYDGVLTAGFRIARPLLGKKSQSAGQAAGD